MANTPAAIETESMQIISAELAGLGIRLDDAQAPVIRRVIHATADFDYARTLRFTQDAVAHLTEALRQGAPIVTDTNMAKAGISAPSLAGLNTAAHCLMAEPETAALARAEGTTRAVASMRLAARRYPGAVFVIGNAPTALMELSALIYGGYRPGGIIGVPVGFVNAAESKEALFALCRAQGIPGIFALGRKGGSSVAAAVCNALLYLALDTTDPHRRGWY